MKEKLNEMRRLYEAEGWTLQQIGDCFGVTRQAVHDRFKRAGIKMRASKPVLRLLDRETLVDLYSEKRLTILEVAQHLNTNRVKVSQELKRHGIEKIPKRIRHRKYSDLYEMKVGERIVIERPEVKNPYRSLHSKAGKKGIKISVKRIDENTYQVIRIG